jgi:hypothetical protein
LNVIPTADVLDRGVISLESESAGAGRPWGDGCDMYALSQIGIGSGVELGMDRCLGDSESWVNVKWRMRDESGRTPALAVGVQGIGEGATAQPYVVALKSFGNTRIHTGMVAIDRKSEWMIGVDHPLGSRVTLQVDYISGDENSMTYGAAVGLTSNLSLTLARSSGNTDATGNGHVINLAWSMSL